MSLPPGALELMSCDPLLGRCSKPPRFCANPDSAHASARGPKIGRVLMGGYFWQEVVSSPNSLVRLEAHDFAVVTALLLGLDVRGGSQRPVARG
jgi:hypothetical protein